LLADPLEGEGVRSVGAVKMMLTPATAAGEGTEPREDEDCGQNPKLQTPNCLCHVPNQTSIPHFREAYHIDTRTEQKKVSIYHLQHTMKVYLD
jgi:hypothetical protein